MIEIKVKFPDGTIIEKDNGTETFVEVIKVIGVEKVYALDLTALKYPLITDYRIMDKHPDVKKNQKPIGDYWILYGMHNKVKRQLLRKISSRLGVGLKVEPED